MNVTENRYEGITIDAASIPNNSNDFENELNKVLEIYSSKKLVWIYILHNNAHYIPILTKLYFTFFYCTEHSILLVKKLQKDAYIPTQVNYILGVGAVVFNNNSLLVIKDRFINEYKLPGGHIDKNEQLQSALIREVKEETGISVEFESIINIGHFNVGQFGESNMYIVCTAKALSQNIHITDTAEITEACWMNTHDFLQSENVNNFNKAVVKAALEQNKAKLVLQNITLKVASAEVFM